MSNAGKLNSSGGGGGSVTSITGTANQVIASASTGAVTLSTPQQIATTSSPTFASLTLTGNLNLPGSTNRTTGVINVATVPYISVYPTDDNIFIGKNSGPTSYTAGQVTDCFSLGDATFQHLNDASDCIAIGYGALQAATAESDSIAIGTLALNASTGANTTNIAIGTNSLLYMTSGSGNICIGYDSGSEYLTNESYNIIIGWDQPGSTGDTNSLYIGNGTGNGAGQLNYAQIGGINGTPSLGGTGTLVAISEYDQLYAIDNGSAGQVLTSNGTSPPTFQNVSVNAFAVINIQTFTSNGTYTPTAGMLYCIIELVGGGGGGGGAASTGATTVSCGGGGGSGGYARKFASASTVGASKTVTIGTGGTAGANTGGTGGTGGTTSVGSICVATGGSGGNGAAASSISANNGGNPGSGTTGDINASGNAGGWSLGIGAAGFGFANQGYGGTSFFEGGPLASVNTVGAVGAAGSKGSGGTGGANGNSQASGVLGGAGGAGYVVITEYI